jgi:ABC-type methionine transport system ATPase subunit
LRLLGLNDREANTPAQLSGGQQQRVAIARALINSPSPLLADEPTGNLDTRTSHEIMETLVGLNGERGVTIIVVTHEADIAAYAARVITLRDGEIVGDESKPSRVSEKDASGVLEGHARSLFHPPASATESRVEARRFHIGLWLHIKEECLNQVVFLGEAHLRRTLTEFVAHYHRERNHQGIHDRLIAPERLAPPGADGHVYCRARLGGLLRYYHRAA